MPINRYGVNPNLTSRILALCPESEVGERERCCRSGWDEPVHESYKPNSINRLKLRFVLLKFQIIQLPTVCVVVALTVRDANLYLLGQTP